MRGQDNKQVQDHYILRRRVSVARNALSVVAGILLAIILIGLAGCATKPQGYQTLVPSPYERSQDFNREDDNVVEFCQSWAIQQISAEVQQMLAEGVNPEDITEQMVIDGVGKAYDFCIRVNGRQASVATDEGPSRG